MRYRALLAGNGNHGRGVAPILVLLLIAGYGEAAGRDASAGG